MSGPKTKLSDQPVINTQTSPTFFHHHDQPKETTTAAATPKAPAQLFMSPTDSIIPTILQPGIKKLWTYQNRDKKRESKLVGSVLASYDAEINSLLSSLPTIFLPRTILTTQKQLAELFYKIGMSLETRISFVRNISEEHYKKEVASASNEQFNCQQIASDLGDLGAQNNLARCLYDGVGCSKNEDQAVVMWHEIYQKQLGSYPQFDVIYNIAFHFLTIGKKNDDVALLNTALTWCKEIMHLFSDKNSNEYTESAALIADICISMQEKLANLIDTGTQRSMIDPAIKTLITECKKCLIVDEKVKPPQRKP